MLCRALLVKPLSWAVRHEAISVHSPQWRTKLQSISSSLWSGSQIVSGWEVIYRPVFFVASFTEENSDWIFVKFRRKNILLLQQFGENKIDLSSFHFAPSFAFFLFSSALTVLLWQPIWVPLGLAHLFLAAFFYMFIFPPFDVIILSKIYLLCHHIAFICFLLSGLQAYFFLWTSLFISHRAIHKHQIQDWHMVWIFSIYLCIAIILTHRRSVTVLPSLVSLALNVLFVLYSQVLVVTSYSLAFFFLLLKFMRL